MSAEMKKANMREVSQLELQGLARLAAPMTEYPTAAGAPYFGDDGDERAKYEAEEAKCEADKPRREQAASDFKKQVDQLLSAAYAAGAESAVNAETQPRQLKSEVTVRPVTVAIPYWFVSRSYRSASVARGVAVGALPKGSGGTLR
jgi:hypothetical protein